MSALLLMVRGTPHHDPSVPVLPPIRPQLVLAAVVRDDGRVLIAQRPHHKRHGGLWEFPGGKLESGESLHDAAVRELREELGVEVIGTQPPLFSCRDTGSPFEIVFAPVEVHGQPVAHEHQELAWVTEEELLSYELAPSDHQFALFLRGN
jgi:mutator protein MutT